MESSEEAGEAPPRSGRWLLVADLDDTLWGDPDALDELLLALGRAPGLLWAVNSSRPLADVRAGLRGGPAAFRPRVWIGAMGTEVEVDDRPLAAWTARFAGWDRRPADRVLARLGCTAHPARFQTPRKASFSVPRSRHSEVRRALREAGVDARTVVSGDSDFDVLPPGACKGTATRFVASHLGIDPESLIVAGDSANDLAMFEVSRRGIVVGNARAELRDRVSPERAYFARAPRAAGVQEGLRHYGALEDSR